LTEQTFRDLDNQLVSVFRFSFHILTILPKINLAMVRPRALRFVQMIYRRL
jgi:hypothetical protein